MLSRYSRVDPETGKYHKPENPAVVYGSMTHVGDLSEMILGRLARFSNQISGPKAHYHGSSVSISARCDCRHSVLCD